MATKSFIKTIGQKGLLADYNTEGKKLQTELTFDTAPKAGSTNPVTSNGIKTAIDAKQNSLTAGDNITISADNVISADKQIFFATYDVTTYDEVKNAMLNGVDVVVKKDSYILHSIWIGNNIYFESIAADPPLIRQFILKPDNSWSTAETPLQGKLTFDTAPTAGSNNPVTSDGIRTMKPIYHQFNNETSSRLIIWGKMVNGRVVDMVRKFGLKYGSVTDFLFANKVHKDDTESVIIKILNDSVIPTVATKRLKASIFKDSSEKLYFALWLDGSISQPPASYYIDYYPDCREDNNTVRHFTVFNPSEYTLVRDLTIKYIPLAVPNPSAGVLTSNGTSNSWLTPPASGTAVLKSVNGVIQWVTE